jgi:DUF2075 family protein
MTSFEIERVPFDLQELSIRATADSRLGNWPVVYALDGEGAVYVGESLNAAARLKQHLKSGDERKQQLRSARIVLDPTFNKSVCLDLESFLIQMFAGDGTFTVLNRNEGITNADYYNRADYQPTFKAVFDKLRDEGLFTRSIPSIQNSDLFKLSPFKALNTDQAAAIEEILEALLTDLASGASSTSVVEGSPGTGKTVIAIFLIKLLRDIATTAPDEVIEGDSFFSDFFTSGYRQLLEGRRIGLVVPQQSLRDSIRNVFKRTPGLEPSMVLTPFEVGASTVKYDVLIVDEAHRLNQRANQPSGPLNKRFAENNERLFGADDLSTTQLDWIRAQSNHQILLFDSAQSVRPADLPASAQRAVIERAKTEHRHHRLASQMRVRAGDDYIGYVRRMLTADPPVPQRFEGYDLRFFDDVGEMVSAVRQRDQEHGLARLVAGYAWKWVSKKDRSRSDVTIGSHSFRWNSTATDWINSPGSLDEVGSIHTVQGYDLNYAGVMIGPDLRWDESTHRIAFDRTHYFDKKGKENNPKLGVAYSDDDLLTFVRNIYAVLMTRGIRGTYVYVCDTALREHLRQFFVA